MNDARKRRKDLQKRIAKWHNSPAYALLQTTEEAREALQHPKPESTTVNALVFLKSDPHWIRIKLPKDSPTAAIAAMRKNGFWAEYADCPSYFPPEEIVQVSIVE